MAYPLTKCEMEFYESARHSLASISQTLSSFTDDVIKKCLANIVHEKLMNVKENFICLLEKGAMEKDEQAHWQGKIEALKELIKEIEDGKI